jgi:hypothetical protein
MSHDETHPMLVSLLFYGDDRAVLLGAYEDVNSI